MRGINVATADLIERAQQAAQQQELQREQMLLAARTEGARYAAELAARNIQEARYGAQAQHFAQTEANQSAAERIREENEAKQTQMIQNKYNLDNTIAKLKATTDNARETGYRLQNDIVGMARDGLDAPTIARGLNGSLAKHPELRDTITDAFPSIGVMLQGKFDPAKLAQRPLVDEKTGAPTGQGVGGEGRKAAGIQYQDAAKAAQDEPDAGKQDSETDDAWESRSARLTQLRDLNLQNVARDAGWRADQTTTETGTNPYGLAYNKSRTTTFGVPQTGPALPGAAAPAGQGPMFGPPASKMAPPGAAPQGLPGGKAQPATTPNLQIPPVQPSASADPGLTPPPVAGTTPQGASGSIMVKHPTTHKVGAIPATNWPQAQAAGFILAQ